MRLRNLDGKNILLQSAFASLAIDVVFSRCFMNSVMDNEACQA